MTAKYQSSVGAKRESLRQLVMQELVDAHIFVEAQRVVDTLKQGTVPPRSFPNANLSQQSLLNPERQSLITVSSRSMQELVDAHIFVEAQRVVDALKQRDCAPALAWCSQHAAKLKKIRSRLEFKLRLQVGLCILHLRLPARMRLVLNAVTILDGYHCVPSLLQCQNMACPYTLAFIVADTGGAWNNTCTH